MKKIDKKKIGNSGKEIDRILREIFRLETKMKSGFNDLHKSFSQLQGAVDNYAQRADTYFQEMVMLSRKVDRLEKWVHQIAEKTGVHLRT